MHNFRNQIGKNHNVLLQYLTGKRVFTNVAHAKNGEHPFAFDDGIEFRTGGLHVLRHNGHARFPKPYF